MREHKKKLMPGFTEKYTLTWLAYFDETADLKSAIAREKQIKKWRRSKKIALIESKYPQCMDSASQRFAAKRPLALGFSLRSK